MQVFDEYAQKYDEWYEKPFGSSVFKLELACLQGLSQTKESSVEVGVGSGRFAEALRISFGVDTSRNLLEIAKRRGITVVLGRAEGLPFKKGSFDQVYMIVSICFFEDPISALREAHRVLKSKGELILGLIFAESHWAKFYQNKAKLGHPLYSRAKFYHYQELERMLHLSGFDIESVHTTLFAKPQDEYPITSSDIKPTLNFDGGFFALKALKKP